VASKDVEAPAVPGAFASWAHEQRTTAPDGDGTALMLVSVVGSILLVINAGGTPGAWTWPVVA
jgi:hypothetical protein